jgi:hypothetical protein
MTSDTEKNSENENNKLEKIVNEKKKIILRDVLDRIHNLIESEFYYIKTTEISKSLNTVSKILAIGDFYEEIISLMDDLDNNNEYYLNSVESTLGLKNTIQEQEDAVNLKIREIAENLKQKFYYLFCYVKDNLNTSCPNAMISTMDNDDVYHFQVSKLRDALNHLALLQPYIVDVVSDDNLKDLSADNFVNLYKNGNNFNSNIVQGKIIDYLELLKKQGEEETKENVKKIKEVIKKGFTYDLPEFAHKQLYESLFSNQKDLEEKFDLIFVAAKKIARNGYLEDVKILKDSEFSFDAAKISLEEIFKKLWENYSKLLTDKKDELLNKLTFTKEFDNKLLKNFEDKIYSELNNYRDYLIQSMIARASKNCILLDNKITLTDIVEEAINELKNEISTDTKKNLESGYKEAFKDYKNTFEVYFKDFEAKLKQQYRHLSDSIDTLLTQNSVTSSSNKKTGLTDETKKGFEEGIDYCLKEFETLIGAKNLTVSIDDDEKINSLFNDIFSRITFRIPNIMNGLDENIERLKETCDQELKREKDSFKDEILEYIKLGFNYTIKNFMKGSGKSYLDGIFLNDYDINIVPKLDYIKAQSEEIDYYMYLVIEGLNDIDSYLSDSIREVYYILMNYINDGITLSEINAKLIKKIEQFKIDSAKKIVEYFKSYTLEVLNNNSFLNILSDQVKALLPTYVPYTLTLNFAIIYKDLLDSLYLTNLITKYRTNIIQKKEEIIDDLQKLREERFLHIGKLAQRNENSALATSIEEYNELNATLSKINNNFTLDLTNDKKYAVDQILLNSTVISYFNRIPTDYNNVAAKIQSDISTNVKLNINLNDFRTYINQIAEKLKNTDPSEEIKKIRTEFYSNLTLLFDDLENAVKQKYIKQVPEKGDILPINFGRRLDENEENVDIKIESIQAAINLIDIKIIQLTQNIANSNIIIDIANDLNQINNKIDIELITLDNTMESYLKYSRFYLNVEETLNGYQQNITNIYNEVENILQNLMVTQADNLRSYYTSLEDYKEPYYEEFKPKLVEKINNVMKKTSTELIGNLKDKSDNGIKEYPFYKETELKNIEPLVTVFGTTRLNYAINVQNAALRWTYDFKTDADNHCVNLDLTAIGESNASITYSNEYFETAVGETIGKAKIGLKIKSDFSIDRVDVNYYTQHYNNTFAKTLNEITKLDSWGLCEDAINCYVVTPDQEFCPYIVRIEDGNENIVDVDSNDLGYYKNSTIYKFTGFYENKLCTYANYFYEIEETKYEFESSLHKTV